MLPLQRCVMLQECSRLQVVYASIVECYEHITRIRITTAGVRSFRPAPFCVLIVLEVLMAVVQSILLYSLEYFFRIYC